MIIWFFPVKDKLIDLEVCLLLPCLEYTEANFLFFTFMFSPLKLLKYSFAIFSEPEQFYSPFNRYLVPRDMSVGQFIHILSGRLQLAPGKALFVFVKNTLPQTCKLRSILISFCSFSYY